MSIVYGILAGLATAAGALGTLMFLIIALAGSGNATPRQMAAIQSFMLIVAIVAVPHG